MIAKQSDSAAPSPSAAQTSSTEQAGSPAQPDKRRRVRIHHLQESKRRGEAWPMLTSYDTCSARIFDEAGIPVLLVGDSAANSVYGYESSLPVEVDELLPLTRAVTRSVEYALVVADLPFGSYQASTEQALATATRFMKEGRAHAVKLEGGRRYAAQVEALVAAGIPVMGHVGFTPQSEHRLGGYRVQARDGAEELVADALALQEAGAFAVVLEMVSAEAAKHVTAELDIPTVGIGAGPDCDAQVLVWTDMAGMSTGRSPRFAKRYADLGGELARAAGTFAEEVRSRSFPAPEHSFR